MHNRLLNAGASSIGSSKELASDSMSRLVQMLCMLAIACAAAFACAAFAPNQASATIYKEADVSYNYSVVTGDKAFVRIDGISSASKSVANVPARILDYPVGEIIITSQAQNFGTVNELNISKLPELTRISCTGSPLQYVYVSDCAKLQFLDISNSPKLESLTCLFNKLTTLNVGDAPRLARVY